MPGPRLYSSADLALLRMTLAPRPADLGRHDLREPDDPARLRDAVQAFSDDPALAAALELASGDLARAIARPWSRHAAGPPRDRHRMTVALTGYMLRLRHRATPFGLFAGSGLIPVAEPAGGGAGVRPRLLVRPSPRWVAGLVAELESDPALPAGASGVRIAAAPSLRTAGPWHVLADRETGGPGRWPARAAVRRSPLLDVVLALAGLDGTGYQALLDLLHAAAPQLREDQLARYVSRLLAAGFLVTNLLPPPGHADPVGYLAERLGGHPVVTRLRVIRTDLRRAPGPATAPWTDGEVRRLRAGLREIYPRDADLAADTLLGTGLRLPRLVTQEVEQAASVAWTCTPARPSRPLAALHHAMLDRYGPDCPVPLPELLDPAESLGLHSFLASPQLPKTSRSPDPAGAGRDRMLTGLALDALAAGHTGLLLDRPLRHRLSAARGYAGPPPSADVFTEVITASAQALDQGDFLVVLGSPGYPAPAGATAGRLAAQFGPGAACLAAPPDGNGPLDVELVYQPPDPAAANLVAETGWTEFRIDLTRSAGPGRDVALTDLTVIATPEGLRLRSERIGRDIRPVSFCALDPGHAGPVAGFLLALGRYGAAPWRPWDWGAAAALPRLPRVWTGRAILAPARWRIPPDLRYLAGAGTGRQWRDGLRRWRDGQEVPDVVMAGPWDQRLPLDLDDPVHAELLRRECRDHAVVTVAEPPGGLTAWRARGWPSGPGGTHTAEIVFSLHPTGTAALAGCEVGGPVGEEHAQRPNGALGGPDGPRAAAPDGDPAVFLPGGSWLCAGLAVPEMLQEGVLAELADEALQAAAGQAEVDRWFFVRAADPAGVPQLRLRFHGPASRLNHALLPALHAWSGRLRAAGLVRDFSLLSYRPERQRYGDGACLAAAERFFHADSRLSLELLGREAAAPERLAAPGVLDILVVMLGSRHEVRALPRPRLSAAQRRRLTAVSSLRDQPPVTVHPHGQGAGSAWPEWHLALGAYRSRLSDAGRDPVAVARSLVHMHCNRIAGPSRATERIAVALAHDLASRR